MKTQLYKDLVGYLGMIARIIEDAKKIPHSDECHKGFIEAHIFVQGELADLLLKAEPNTMEVTTHQNWDS